jgi:hypothetical protein
MEQRGKVFIRVSLEVNNERSSILPGGTQSNTFINHKNQKAMLDFIMGVVLGALVGAFSVAIVIAIVMRKRKSQQSK